MAISPRHYSTLEKLVINSPEFDKKHTYARPGKTMGQYRWNCLMRSTFLTKEDKSRFFQELYAYLTDSQIDAALQRITETH